MTRPRHATPRGMIPAAPILRMVDEWLAQQGEQDWQASGNGHANRLGEIAPLGPLKVLGHRVYPNNPESIWRALLRMRHESDWVSFALADKLVSATFGPQHWHADPELEALYVRYLRIYDGDELLTDDEILEWAAATWETLHDEDRRAIRSLTPTMLTGLRMAA